MKKFLLLLVALLSFVINGCVEDAPIGPEVPVVGNLKLSPEEMTVGAEEGEYSVNIYTEYTFQASSSVDWIEILYGSCGTEYCTQYFNVKANTTTSPREGVITIFCDDYNLSAELTITQEAGEEVAGIPTNEIWYTSIDGEVVTPRATDVFGANIVSNTYENGKGVITFDDDVTSIGDWAFYKCSSLTNVTIPDSVTEIGYGSFADTSLTSVTIPDSVTSIGINAFYDCTSLTSITIPDSVTSIGGCAFLECTSLTSVTIPDSVTEIGNYAFEGCSSLTSVTIPDSVTSIGNSAFSGCTSLTSVYCKPITPPTGGYEMFSYYSNGDYYPIGCKIYVPRNSVSAYKSAECWSDYASDIVGYDF